MSTPLDIPMYRRTAAQSKVILIDSNFVICLKLFREVQHQRILRIICTIETLKFEVQLIMNYSGYTIELHFLAKSVGTPLNIHALIVPLSTKHSVWSKDVN